MLGDALIHVEGVIGHHDSTVMTSSLRMYGSHFAILSFSLLYSCTSVLLYSTCSMLCCGLLVSMKFRHIGR